MNNRYVENVCPYIRMGENCEDCSLNGYCPETRDDKKDCSEQI